MARGPLYCIKFDRDATSRETELSLQIAYGATTASGQPFDATSKIFIVAKYRTVREITVANGQIVSVVGIDS
jgi:hypothetical protein